MIYNILSLFCVVCFATQPSVHKFIICFYFMKSNKNNKCYLLVIVTKIDFEYQHCTENGVENDSLKIFFS